MFLISSVQSEVNWKLSSAETYSKMRLKLVPNYNCDSHSDASAQRDNMGTNLGLNVVLYSYMLFTLSVYVFVCVCLCSTGADSPRSSEPLPLAVAKEAKVSEMEDDQLAEEDVNFLEDK